MSDPVLFYTAAEHAAYRKGMLRAAEIADVYALARGRPDSAVAEIAKHQCLWAECIAKTIRAEAGEEKGT